MKFKIGFTIDGETLFKTLAQFLPVQDVSVEEIPTTRPAPALPHDWKPEWSKQIAKPKPKPKVKRKPSVPMDLTAGINRIIMEALAHGMARSSKDIAPALVKGGYSPNSIGSRLAKLQEHGIVESMKDGTWRLTEKHLPKVSNDQKA